jgi:hypothetical protein
MPALTNLKHERFAIGMAKNVAGADKAQVYIDAGYKAKDRRSAEACAGRLLLNVAICARIAEIAATITAGVIKSEIANKDWRTVKLHDVNADIDRIRAARAKDPTILKCPGGDTGWVVATARVVTGPNDVKMIVTDHSVDVALMREYKSTLRQVAEELGQLTQKHEVGGMTDAAGNPAGVPIQVLVLTPAEDEA